MRIDKYLWCTRYFKTRSLASAACRKGHVKVNGQAVKPSREVYPQDKIELRKEQINYEIRVLDLPSSRVGAKIVNLYREDTTPASAFEHNELLRQTKEFYRKKGSGRPTKKDRRDLEGYVGDED